MSGAAVTTVSAGPSATYTVSVDTGAGSRTIRLDLTAGATVQDLCGDAIVGPCTAGETYTIDKGAPAVTSILRHVPLTSPTNAVSVTFRVTFAEDVQNVDTTDFGAALIGSVTGSVNAVAVQSASVHDVTITGVGGDGRLGLSFQTANAIQDLAANPLGPSPTVGTEENYTIDKTAIALIAGGVVGFPGSVTILDGGAYTSHFLTLEVTFNANANDPAGSGDPDDVTNPNKYQLIEAGPNTVFGVAVCGGTNTDDVLIPTGPVTYSNNGGAGPFVATVFLNGGAPPPNGNYRLLVCGFTSVVGLAGNPLNGGADSIPDFTIFDTISPSTGFASGQVTLLREHPFEFVHRASGMRLEIPRLSASMAVVGVPLVDGKWNAT